MDLGECGGDAAEVAAVPDELSVDELNEDERAMVELVRDFVNRVFNGSAEPLLVHLVEEHNLSKEDLEEIARLRRKS